MFIDEGHLQLFAKNIQEKWKNKELCDIVLIAGNDNTKIPCHRLVLCTGSEFFKAMLAGSYRESIENEVTIHDIDGNILYSLIEFIYTGRLDIREDNVERLFPAAGLLLMNTATQACEDFLQRQLNPTNCLRICLAADKLNSKKLLEQAEIYIMKYFAHIYRTKDFLSLSAEFIAQLIGSDDLCVSSEKDVFNSLLMWIQHDQSMREKQKYELLKLVRMSRVEPSFLMEHQNLICTSPDCQQLFDQAMIWHSLQKDGKTLIANKLKSRKKNNLVMAITDGNEMNIQYYCQVREKWFKWQKSLECRSSFGVAVLDKCLYLVGGKVQVERFNEIVVNSVQCLNLETMTYIDINPMKECRYNCGVAALKGYLYVVGGCNESKEVHPYFYGGRNENIAFLISVERWDPSNNTWDYVAPLSARYESLATIVFNEKLYAIGRSVDDSKNYHYNYVAEVYDQEQDKWNPIASPKVGHGRFSLTVADGFLYAIGGELEEKCERYDPLKNEWKTLKQLYKCPLESFCTTLDDEIIVFYQSEIRKIDEYLNHVEVYCAESDFWFDCDTFIGLDNVVGLISYADNLLLEEFTTVSDYAYKECNLELNDNGWPIKYAGKSSKRHKRSYSSDDSNTSNYS